jgi:hypothetical protein
MTCWVGPAAAVVGQAGSSSPDGGSAHSITTVLVCKTRNAQQNGDHNVSLTWAAECMLL